MADSATDSILWYPGIGRTGTQAGKCHLPILENDLICVELPREFTTAVRGLQAERCCQNYEEVTELSAKSASSNRRLPALEA